MRRSGFRSNARRVLAIVGVVDDYSVDVANTLAVSGNTLSPMSRGAQGVNNHGLPGDGVNAMAHLTGPLQQFIGIGTTQLVVPRAKTGDKLAGSLPGDIGTSGAVAWMDLGRVVGTGYGS